MLHAEAEGRLTPPGISARLPIHPHVHQALVITLRMVCAKSLRPVQPAAATIPHVTGARLTIRGSARLGHSAEVSVMCRRLAPVAASTPPGISARLPIHPHVRPDTLTTQASVSVRRILPARPEVPMTIR